MSFLKLTTVSTIAALSATMAVAEAHVMNTDDLIRSRDITGGTIYRMEAIDTWDDTEMYDAVGDDWNDIGEIEDLVLSRDGQLVAIIGEVGGFLDIGDKHVMIPVENLRLTAVDNQTYYYVTDLTEEEIAAMEDYDEAAWN